MADGPSLALQRALVQHLAGTPAVSALVAGRVYDEPPQAVVFPYLTLGAFDLSPQRLSGCGPDWEVRFGLQAWSRAPSGRVQAQRILEAAIDALDQRSGGIGITGWRIDWLHLLTSVVVRDGDLITHAGTAAFEAALSAVP